MKKFNNVDEYIAGFPMEIQAKLKEMRSLILNSSPKVEESISYGMPAYKLNGKPLVYFAGYQNHIGFYATPNSHKKFADEFLRYKHGKGSVQFPLNEALPVGLIKKIINFKIQESKMKSELFKKQ